VSRLFVRSGRQIVPVAVADITWLEAVGDYVAVHTAQLETAPLVHVTLQRLAARLDVARFVRIHRTHIVNLDQVQAFRQSEGSRLVAQLRSGQELAVSRNMAQELRYLAR
ncbi:MAG: LytTR family transcriptional regulator, partial [Chitinophagaceae bacterium]|nr:LytTR family transcriptional regulator [Rubrivivax sp.]